MTARRREFALMLQDLVPQYGGSKQDLARAIGVTPSAFSRLLGGDPPGIDVCLRLALATGTPAPLVLRAAGYADLDELIQNLYGPATKFRHRGRQLTPLEEQRLKQWRALAPPVEKALSLLLAAAAEHPTRKRRSA